MKIGYARVSTDAQETHLQMDALKRARCSRIYQEKASGSKADRPELMRLLDNARKGDVVIVWKLDRLARSLRQLIDTDAQRQVDVPHFCVAGGIRAGHSPNRLIRRPPL